MFPFLIVGATVSAQPTFFQQQAVAQVQAHVARALMEVHHLLAEETAVVVRVEILAEQMVVLAMRPAAAVPADLFLLTHLVGTEKFF
jgi:hypothetical protein